MNTSIQPTVTRTTTAMTGYGAGGMWAVAPIGTSTVAQTIAQYGMIISHRSRRRRHVSSSAREDSVIAVTPSGPAEQARGGEAEHDQVSHQHGSRQQVRPVSRHRLVQ